MEEHKSLSMFIAFLIFINTIHFLKYFNTFLRYTADNNGYKADVSYIEGQSGETQHLSQPAIATTPSPLLAAAQPIYNYYRNLQQEEPSYQHNNVNYDNSKYVDYDNSYQHPAPQNYIHTTPATYYVGTSTPSAVYADHNNYIENVEIDTYNTGPHKINYHHHLSPTSSPLSKLSGGYEHNIAPTQSSIVFPTTPTAYNDIHVLPSPKSFSYSTIAPYAGSKSTSIVASPAPQAAYYADYDYKTNQDGSQQEQYYATAAPSLVQTNVLLRPNHALYYKQHAK